MSVTVTDWLPVVIFVQMVMVPRGRTLGRFGHIYDFGQRKKEGLKKLKTWPCLGVHIEERRVNKKRRKESNLEGNGNKST